MPAVSVRHLGKRFRRYHPLRPGTLQEALQAGMRRARATEWLWALRDVSLELEPGDSLALLGQNGAGKSTLLRMIGGVGRPDEGSVSVHGRVGALLELGAGMHPDLTGLENAMLAGVIQGLTRRQVKQRMDGIAAFAELEDFLDQPLRTYSVGMQMRLAFAVAVHSEPDILLIDEALAVGDLRFQDRCQRRIAEFREEGVTLILVSHDLGLARRFCDRAVWLRGGRVAATVAVGEVAEAYRCAMSAETLARTPPAAASPEPAALRLGENRFGSQEARIREVRLDGGHAVAPGDPLSIRIDYACDPGISGVIAHVSVRTEQGILCCDLNSSDHGILAPGRDGGTIELAIERLDLAPGSYVVDVGLYEGRWAYAYDVHRRAYKLAVGGPAARGVLRPPHRWVAGA